jgi:hypothetical protein
MVQMVVLIWKLAVGLLMVSHAQPFAPSGQAIAAMASPYVHLAEL